MRVELIRIGNSRGIRIPKPLIEQCGLGETVELNVEKGRLTISPGRQARAGWRDAFLSAGSSAEDAKLMGSISDNEFDAEEWTW
jgi:antitoxin MazE